MTSEPESVSLPVDDNRLPQSGVQRASSEELAEVPLSPPGSPGVSREPESEQIPTRESNGHLSPEASEADEQLQEVSLEADRQSTPVTERESPELVKAAAKEAKSERYTAASKFSAVFIESTMKIIQKSKDAKRIPVLAQSVGIVLKQFADNTNNPPSPSVILEPLRIVCAQGSSTELRVEALDCIAKLFTFSVLDEEADPNRTPSMPILDRAVDIVCDTFDGESTDSRIELQLVKALTAATVNDELVLHGSTLLRAIRQVYNVFVMSRSQSNQHTAQVSLTQMVQAVFERLKRAPQPDYGAQESSSSTTLETSEPQALTLEKMQGATLEEDPTGSAYIDLITQDAFLVFRTLCKLSEKSDVDVTHMKGHSMRSKLLSLHLIHMVMKEQMSVFSSKTLKVKFRNRNLQFPEAVKDYLSSTLSHNAASISPPVYEISAEIFSLVLSNLRSEFKREVEVFFKEVYLTIMDMRTATIHQKMYFLSLVSRICSDPRALVELYLNYDCDPASSNVFEKLIEMIGRFAVPIISMNQNQLVAYYQDRNRPVGIYNLNLPPGSSIAQVIATNGKLPVVAYPREYAMKIIALESLVSVLRSLLVWSNRGMDDADASNISLSSTAETSVPGESVTTLAQSKSSGHSRNVSIGDDPSQFASLKTSKKALDQAVLDFNYNAEQGVDKLLALGVIKSKEPEQVAKVLLDNDGFDKQKLGEYMGKEHPFNRSVMHHFVDQMDFKNLSFLDALRFCLQQFRLPGEGQVVDRYLLEFATKYHQDNPTVFTNADTPYTMGYSVVLLNTELHSPQVKRQRMSLQDFIINNRGINDGLDLPADYLTEIYNEIKANEIKLVSEQQQAAIKGHYGARDSRSAYLVASEVISSKTAELFKRGAKGRKSHSSMYYNASHVEHVKPMFEVCWMSILAGLSACFQDDEPDTITLSLEGMYLAVRIACHFDISLARTSFVHTLVQFTGLSFGDVSNVQVKSIDAMQALLKAALAEGNTLRMSWKDVLMMISQFERLQLIVSGVSAGSIPDLGSLRRESMDRYPRGALSDVSSDVIEALRTQDLAINTDRIFTQSATLSAEAIVEFVGALAEVALDEIESSRDSSEPRMFSLQKIVDVCYYNMDRIRREWSQIWAQMGLQFNKVCCHSNEKVNWFALDSLRQLTMRFLDLEELPHFKFQKDFLNPFVYTMENSTNPRVKGFVLDCLTQMIVSKPKQLVSGWEAVFSTINESATLSQDTQLVVQGANLLTKIGANYLHLVTANEFLPNYLNSLAAMGKQQNAKVALHAVMELRAADKLAQDQPERERMWMILSLLLTALHKVSMEGADLEVRGRALNSLFDILMDHGDKFTKDDWDHIGKEQLFPLFKVLELPKEQVNDDTKLWLSTTLIQALRNIVRLFGRYFDMLEHSLDTFFLDLLKTCICQENETVSRIGASCFRELVTENAARFEDRHWRIIVDKLELFFRRTTANDLINPELIKGKLDRHKLRLFQKAMTQSIQQKIVVEMTGELLKAPEVAKLMPAPDIIRIVQRLAESYHFARRFNSKHDLRTQLFQQGYMKQTPNLLLQETLAAQNYLSVATVLFNDKAKLEEDHDLRRELRHELMALCRQLILDYNAIPASDTRMVEKLSPIAVQVLDAVCSFSDEEFKRNVGKIYHEVVNVLDKDLGGDLRIAVQSVLRKVAKVHIAV